LHFILAKSLSEKITHGIVKSESAFAQAALQQKRLTIFEPGRQAAELGRQSYTRRPIILTGSL
jgi:hypothetical protein